METGCFETVCENKTIAEVTHTSVIRNILATVISLRNRLLDLPFAFKLKHFRHATACSWLPISFYSGSFYKV